MKSFTSTPKQWQSINLEFAVVETQPLTKSYHEITRLMLTHLTFRPAFIRAIPSRVRAPQLLHRSVNTNSGRQLPLQIIIARHYSMDKGADADAKNKQERKWPTPITAPLDDITALRQQGEEEARFVTKVAMAWYDSYPTGTNHLWHRKFATVKR